MMPLSEEVENMRNGGKDMSWASVANQGSFDKLMKTHAT